jgi:muconolactone delta-isomerase
MKQHTTKRRTLMQYLVEMRLASSARPMSSADGVTFIERLILPTLELCKKLQDDGKIVAGGPRSGAVALALIVNAESARELDDLITSLPIWPRMETEVTPLTTFDERAQTVRIRLEDFKTQGKTIAVESAA